MKTISRYIMTLVALLAMTTGAWADGTATITLKCGQTVKTYEDATLPWTTTADILKAVVTDINFNISIQAISGGDGKVEKYGNENFKVTGTFSGEATVTVTYNTGSSATITVTAPAPLIALDETKTVATMAAMPAYDATVSYELVRDLAAKDDAALTFSGIPTGGGATVKKDGDKYTFATAPTITLNDPLASNADIIGAEGLTLNVYPMVEVVIFEDLKGWKADETATPVALADFLASPQPGRWMIKATAETGLYDGTLYSPEFTLAEAYDLTLSPATDANLKSVTVAGTAKTADEKGVIKNIEPTKKVKITTTGPDYIIRKATVKKTEKMKTLQIGGETTATIYYIEGESWTDAITNHPTENAGWKAFTSQITYDGSAYVLFYGGSTTKVNPGENIDSTKTYKLES